MKKLIAAPVIVATLAASSFALAGGPDNMAPMQSEKQGKVSIAFDGGYAWGRSVKAQNGVLQGNPFVKTSGNERHAVLGAHVGYQFEVMPKLGVGAEVGYLHLGSTDVTAQNPVYSDNSYDYQIKQQMLTFLATANYNLYKGLDAVVKAGGAYVWQDNNFTYYDSPSVTDRNLSASNKLKKVRPLIGVGLSYNFHNFVVGVTYDHLFGVQPSSKEVADQDFTIKDTNKKIYSANIVMGSIGYALPI